MSATSKPWLVAALVWTAVILAVNSVSVTNVAVPTFAGADKLTHAAMYALAAFAWRSSIRSPSETASWLVVLAIAILGAIDEWHQLIVPGRSADVRDWLADVCGALVGVGVWRWIRARKRAIV
ncbi:MAG: VanZ family protein [Gemmatimonadaceae bacterium]